MTIACSNVPAALRQCLMGLDRETAEAGQGWLVRLMRREGPGIVRMLWRLLANEQDVLDAYQDCVCRLAVKGRDGAIRNRGAYAYRTATHIGIEMLRRRARRRAHLPAAVDTRARVLGGGELHGAGAAQRNEMIEQLREHVLQLPPHLRDVVVLRDLGEQPYRVVASILGIRVGTARVYRRHAILRLAESMNGSAGSTE